MTINYVPPVNLPQAEETVITIEERTASTDTREDLEEKSPLRLSKKHKFEQEEDGNYSHYFWVN